MQDARLFKPGAAGDGGSINRRASSRLCSQMAPHSTQESTWTQGEFPVYYVHLAGDLQSGANHTHVTERWAGGSTKGPWPSPTTR